MTCSYHWLDEDTIATFVLPQGRGEPPPKPPAPIGPVVSSNLEGAVTQARTYQDLLKNAYDEELFEHYGTSEIAIVQVRPWHEWDDELGMKQRNIKCTQGLCA